MEEKEKNHIDQLFKSKLGDSEATPPDDIWEGIESAIPKSLFFRFRYEQMNVYYSGMIICCFLFSAASLVFHVRNYYETSGHVRNKAVQGVVNSNGEEDEESLSGEQSGAFKSRKKKTHHFGQEETDEKNGETITNKERQDSVVINPNHMKPDSSAQLIKPLNVETEQKPKEKKIKKVVYIMDYDTVVNYDTLRTKRKRR